MAQADRSRRVAPLRIAAGLPAAWRRYSGSQSLSINAAEVGGVRLSLTPPEEFRGQLPGLFGGGEGWGLGCGEDCGGFFGDAGAFEEAGVLRAPEPHCIGEGEVAEIVGGDVAVLDQLIGF